MSGTGLISKILIWRLKHMSDHTFVLIISGMTGIAAGLAAVLLKSFVHYFSHILRTTFPFSEYYFLYLILPVIGIMTAYLLTNYLFKEKVSHGVSSVLYYISKRSSLIKKRNTISKMVTSAVTVCFGGTVGLESPIVVTGSAIGSNIARIAHLNYKRRTIMIGCGAAGAVAGIFNSPVAGLIFAAEVILADVTIASFIPLLISSVCASTVSRILLGDDILFSVQLTESFNTSDVVFYVMLGILCGMVAVYFTRTNYSVERWIQSVKNPIFRASLGGLVVGIVVFVLPPIYGEGYDAIKNLIADKGFLLLSDNLFFSESNKIQYLLLFILLLIIVSAISSALTVGAGGTGGVFAPSLLIGSLTGYSFSKFSSLFLTDNTLSITNFTLVGMCGVMSGVLHAPLTAIFLIAEISGGYTLFIPLMLVSAISYITTCAFEPHSIYTKKLIARGDLHQFNKDGEVLSQLNTNKLIEKDFMTVHVNGTLRDLVEQFKKSKRNLFPVLDDYDRLVGIVTLDDIRRIMFEQNKWDKYVIKTLMTRPEEVVYESEEMSSVISKFERTGKFNLAIVTAEDKYLGFISRGVLFNAYRRKVIRTQKE